jgi:hypothetical protein
MAAECIDCGANLTTATIRIHVTVNGRRIPEILLCQEHGSNGRNVLKVNTHTCLRCGERLDGQVPIAIRADGRYVPGSLCLDHGANNDDHMTAAAYIRLVIASYATAQEGSR